MIKIWNEIKSSQDRPEKVRILLNEYRAKSMRQERSLLQIGAKVINPQKKASNSFQESAGLTPIEFAPGWSQLNE